MAMNLHLLRIFAVVGEHLHISRAAAALRVSQPAVSRGVKELEGQLGVSLLDRGSRTVRLTEAGETLYRHARSLFALESIAEEEMRAHLGLGRGRLRVGASTTVSMYYLPEALARFHGAHPEIEIELTSANTEEVAKGLLEYRYDLAFVEGPVRQQHLLVRKWQDDRLVVIAAPEHPLAKKRKVTNKELAAYPWVAREIGSGTQEVVARYHRAHRIQPRSILRLNSTEAIKRAVEASTTLLAFVSEKSAPHALQAGSLVLLSTQSPPLTRPLNFLSVKSRPLSPAARVFVENLEG